MDVKKISDETKQKLVNSLSAGDSIREACDKVGIDPFDFWNLKKEYPFFAKQCADAREFATELAVDSLKSITDGCETMVDVNAARINSENIKWVASKTVPAIYGDQLNLNINQTLDIGPALLAAAGRVSPLLDLLKQRDAANERDVSEIQTNAPGSKPVVDDDDKETK